MRDRKVKPFLACCILLLAGAAIAKPPDTAYFQNMPLFWSQLYGDGGNTLYCGRPFGPRKGRQINIEHIFPMGWVASALNCGSRSQCRTTSPSFNRIEADMHNLYPALARINKARGSRAFGMVPGERRRFGSCDFEIDPQKRRVEPRPAVRGNIARAMLYMQARYGLRLFPRQAALLRQWHRDDPPDHEELRRNRVIEQIQGQRNPFIDHPEQVAAQ